MRKINDLTKWEDFEKKILSNKAMKKLAALSEAEYQLARSLIKIRLKKRISQKELAEKIGTKQPVISRLENMTSKPTFSLLEKISTALGTHLIIKFEG